MSRNTVFVITYHRHKLLDLIRGVGGARGSVVG
jgi:hypothetical protein